MKHTCVRLLNINPTTCNVSLIISHDIVDEQAGATVQTYPPTMAGCVMRDNIPVEHNIAINEGQPTAISNISKLSGVVSDGITIDRRIAFSHKQTATTITCGIAADHIADERTGTGLQGQSGTGGSSNIRIDSIPNEGSNTRIQQSPTTTGASVDEDFIVVNRCSTIEYK